MSEMTILSIFAMAVIAWLAGLFMFECYISRLFRWPDFGGAALYLFLTAAVCAVVGMAP